MTRNRGCFYRDNDESDAHEYASPPCYMHEVDPAYFGLLPLTRPMSDREPNDPTVIATTPLLVRAPRHATAGWAKLRSLLSELSRTIVRHAATQIERVEARRKVRAVARFRARNGSIR